jgi:hypothetical protein
MPTVFRELEVGGKCHVCKSKNLCDKSKYPSLYTKISTVKGEVFSSFGAKRVKCRAHDSVFVGIDGINGQMRPKGSRVVHMTLFLLALTT